VAMRAVIAVLLAAMCAAVIAFKPFGGSAADLRREQTAVGNQIAGLEKPRRRPSSWWTRSRRRAAKAMSFSPICGDRRTMSSAIAEELNRMAKDAGVRAFRGSSNWTPSKAATRWRWPASRRDMRGPTRT